MSFDCILCPPPALTQLSPFPTYSILRLFFFFSSRSVLAAKIFLTLWSSTTVLWSLPEVDLLDKNFLSFSLHLTVVNPFRSWTGTIVFSIPLSLLGFGLNHACLNFMLYVLTTVICMHTCPAIFRRLHFSVVIYISSTLSTPSSTMMLGIWVDIYRIYVHYKAKCLANLFSECWLVVGLCSSPPSTNTSFIYKEWEICWSMITTIYV